jgi:CHAT domain-containing protein
LTEGRGQEAVRPAVLQVRFTQRQGNGVDDKVGSLDLTLVTPRGPVQSRRVEVDREAFAQLLRSLYSQLSRQDSLDIDNPLSPSRQLHALLLSPIDQRLQEQGITTLLIAADQGLQAVPFAALSDGSRYFGTRYAFGLTPSLALTDLNTASSAEGLLALGASEFKDLAPLPLVPQELDRIVVAGNTDRFLNSEFTPQLLVEKAADPRYARLHVAVDGRVRSIATAESRGSARSGGAQCLPNPPW